MNTIEQIKYKKYKYITNRNNRLSKNERLTPAQHQALAMLCTYRHKIHSHRTDVAEGESHLSDNCMQFIRSFMPVMLRQASLPALDLSDKCLSAPSEAILQVINEEIENYLKEIDASYGTDYAPRGFARKKMTSYCLEQ